MGNLAASSGCKSWMVFCYVLLVICLAELLNWYARLSSGLLILGWCVMLWFDDLFSFWTAVGLLLHCLDLLVWWWTAGGLIVSCYNRLICFVCCCGWLWAAKLRFASMLWLNLLCNSGLMAKVQVCIMNWFWLRFKYAKVCLPAAVFAVFALFCFSVLLWFTMFWFAVSVFCSLVSFFFFPVGFGSSPN